MLYGRLRPSGKAAWVGVVVGLNRFGTMEYGDALWATSAERSSFGSGSASKCDCGALRRMMDS